MWFLVPSILQSRHTTGSMYNQVLVHPLEHLCGGGAINLKINLFLGGGCKYVFMFTPTWGFMIQLDEYHQVYFSDVLKPPTSFGIWLNMINDCNFCRVFFELGMLCKFGVRYNQKISEWYFMRYTCVCRYLTCMIYCIMFLYLNLNIHIFAVHMRTEQGLYFVPVAWYEFLFLILPFSSLLCVCKLLPFWESHVHPFLCILGFF